MKLLNFIIATGVQDLLQVVDCAESSLLKLVLQIVLDHGEQNVPV